MPTTIKDRYSHVPYKGYRCELRKLAKGLCGRCGNAKEQERKDKRNCVACAKFMADANKRYARKKGLTPRRPDKRRGSKY
jgi:hypothetical protein